jgi:hypothetical protein
MESKLNAASPGVRGDAGKLRQVFSYLINNSIKFPTAGGSVTLAVDRRMRSRESHAERRDFAELRREPGVAAAPPAKSGSAVRAMREKLHQR